MSDDPTVLSRSIPLLQTLGIEPVAAEKGEARIRLVVDQKHLRTLGILHGGVSATLLDTALGYAVMSLAPQDHHAVTAQLNINFTRPVFDGETIEAVGRVVHRGSRSAVATGELRTAKGELAATASGTFFYLPLSQSPAR